MAMMNRVYKYTDRPLTWTRAIIYGTLIWGLAILVLGQLPSWIIYKSDQEVAALIEFSARLPGVGQEGVSTKMIQVVRDIVANSVQMGALVVMLAFAYFWQQNKRRRTGTRGVQDVVKGYMPGK
jgi:hypothetical protein